MKASIYFKIITATFVAMTFAMGFLVLTGASTYNVGMEETVMIISAIVSVVAAWCCDKFEKEDC